MTSARPITSSQTGAALPTICGQCSKPDEKLLTCARCGFEKYCSKACQTAAWPAHKKVCKEDVWVEIAKESSTWSGYQKIQWDNVEQRFSKTAPLLEEQFNAPQKDKLALDLGCGLGDSSIFLLKRGWKVIAIDVNERCLNRFRDKANAINPEWIKTGQLTIKTEDATAYPFTEKFSLVVAGNTLSYIDPTKIRSLWGKIYEAIEDGGHLVGDFFQKGRPNEFGLRMFGAWFINDINSLQCLLSKSNYQVQTCRIRPKKYPTSVVEFSVKKPTYF